MKEKNKSTPYAWRMAQFLQHYDGVHVLLTSRDEIGRTYIPDLQEARTPRPIQLRFNQPTIITTGVLTMSMKLKRNID
jgi:hypothetical protein